MRVKLEADPLRRTVKVYLFDFDLIAGNTRMLGYDSSAGATWTVLKDGEAPAPTFELPPDAIEALVAEASDFLPPSSQMAEHLKDARAVRDRLLVLVERVVPGAEAE